jgi:hypothetical protein
LELVKSETAFYLFKRSSDPGEYKMKITNISLIIPIATLSQPLYQEINAIQTRKVDPQPIGLHYRRIEVRPVTLPKHKVQYFSDNLFTDSDIPCRIILAFVETDNKIGELFITNI